MRIMITGANGHLGRQLIARLQGSHELVAVVRSERAARSIKDAGLDPELHIVDYTDARALATAAAGCQGVVHLVGIIKQSRSNTFENAHEAPCRALVSACVDSSFIISLGIVGSDSPSGNECLQSRARAEEILQSGPVPATILRVPMVIGPEDYASRSLARNGRGKLALTFRADSREQPVASDTVLDAIVSILELEPAHRVIELGGPENLSRKELIERAGQVFGNRPMVVSLPVRLGSLLAMMAEKLSDNPPVTRAMLGVLDHDDIIDNGPALRLLGIEIEPLDTTLQRYLSRF